MNKLQNPDRDFNDSTKHPTVIYYKQIFTLPKKIDGMLPIDIRKCIRACGLKGVYKNKKVHDTD